MNPNEENKVENHLAELSQSEKCERCGEPLHGDYCSDDCDGGIADRRERDYYDKDDLIP